MSDTPITPEDNETAQAQASAMPIVVHAQYVKDLSFENPNAPMSLQPADKQPDVSVKVDVQARRIRQDDPVFEVLLVINAETRNDDQQLFLLELTYGGVFSLRGAAEEHLHPLVMIECPRLLFPYARAMVSETTRDGGFPPLMLQPIDFVELYRRRLAQQDPTADSEVAGHA
ncbi:MAG: protein-export chaperone SecB [Alphaproteobacteria bacterium]|nr:protein-export chaperone SecB [Alphaproteobacteria bacterium]MBU0798915.1 protein-export chaperone SecB [Alphaproteobacteria bacterium]MBU0886303.1 protein-export chaperone SecB [Alphaproteobacteria bacterium]MBU1813501.1 protein-export chaperone SecB [Alphaproteobacteria bacterium]MBU2091697.1 protein-export chaperone SecB [Alphaproteobacteria bacterium]